MATIASTNSTPLKEYSKDPDAELDYSLDWRPWLQNDTISQAGVVWTVPAGLTQPLPPESSMANGIQTVWLGGGTPGQVYLVTCRIRTTGGRADERTISIRVIER